MHENKESIDDKPQPPSLTIDWEAYAPYLDDNDLPDDQKKELIERLWNIIVACVELRFDVQSADSTCAQNDEEAALLSSDLLSLGEDNPDNQKQSPVDNATHLSAEKEES